MSQITAGVNTGSPTVVCDIKSLYIKQRITSRLGCVINDDVVVTFKSDGQGIRKGFEAVYTFIPVDACEYRIMVESISIMTT